MKAVLLLIGFVLANIHFAEAQKVHRIGYLSAFDPTSDSARSEGIRLALRELGYTEGQNITIESRYAKGERDRFPDLAAELVVSRLIS
jgi:putative tryptophan/tyrosine transport system substrate-binding protein